MTGSEFDLTSKMGDATMSGMIADDGVSGVLTLPDGVPRRYFAAPSGEGAGIYTVQVAPDRRHTGTSEQGAKLERRALRLDPFLATPNTDLFVWASESPAPRTSADALFTPHVQLAELKATAGAQNYVLPDSLPLDRVRSIVIWCEPVRTAYAAAPLPRR